MRTGTGSGVLSCGRVMRVDGKRSCTSSHGPLHKAAAAPVSEGTSCFMRSAAVTVSALRKHSRRGLPCGAAT